MFKRFLIPLLVLLFSSLSWGQITNPSVTMKTFAGAPSGTCTARQLAVNTTTGDLYACNAGTWKLAGGGAGAGTTTGPASPTNQHILTSDGTAQHVQDPGSCTLTSTLENCPSALVWGWNLDTGFSRLAAHSVALGNGTAGDFTGLLKLTRVTFADGTFQTTAASGGVTNGAGNNVITKSDGTNLVASSVTDNGTVVTSTEPLVVPDGSTGVGNGGIQFAGQPGSSIFRTGVGICLTNYFIGPGSVVFCAGTDPTFSFGAVAVPVGGVFGWANNALPSAADTGLSRLGAHSVVVGDGTPGNASGTLGANRINAGTIDTVSGNLTIATGDGTSTVAIAPGGNVAFVGNANGISVQIARIVTYIRPELGVTVNAVDSGVPVETGAAGRDQVGLTAALGATTICTPQVTGRYRISVYEKVTTAASVSSVLGGGTGTVLTFTDGTDSVAQSITMGLDNQGGTLSIFNNGNTTATSLNGAAYVYALTGVPIQLAVGYTSTGTAMAYAVRATCEML